MTPPNTYLLSLILHAAFFSSDPVVGAFLCVFEARFPRVFVAALDCLALGRVQRASPPHPPPLSHAAVFFCISSAFCTGFSWESFIPRAQPAGRTFPRL